MAHGGDELGEELGRGRPPEHGEGRVPVPEGVDTHGAGAAPGRPQRELQGPVVGGRAHRGKVREPVGGDGAREVDGLAAGSDEGQLDRPRRHARRRCRSRQARTLARFPQTSILHHFPERFFDRS